MLCKVGHLIYREPKGDWEVDVYFATIPNYIDPKETEEMIPKWFSLDNIPYGQMWENDKIWLKRILNKEYINAEFSLDEKGNILKQKITPFKK